MKSKGDFLDENEYWEYVHTDITKSVMCVLLSRRWETYKAAAEEASKVADETVKVLKKRK